MGLNVLNNYFRILGFWRVDSRHRAKKGVSGKKLLRFQGKIPANDLLLMTKAIEVGCEKVDIDEW